MNALYSSWARAHADLMNATGWDVLTEKLATAVRESPEAVSLAVEDALTYVHLIDWREPFFLCLAATHCLVALGVVVGTWGNVSDTRLEVCTCALLILAQCTFALNPLGRRNAPLLFREPRTIYFDERGLFVTLFLWTPVMCLAMWLLLRVVLRFVSLLVRVGRKRAAAAQESPAHTESKKAQ